MRNMNRLITSYYTGEFLKKENQRQVILFEGPFVDWGAYVYSLETIRFLVWKRNDQERERALDLEWRPLVSYSTMRFLNSHIILLFRAAIFSLFDESWSSFAWRPLNLAMKCHFCIVKTTFPVAFCFEQVSFISPEHLSVSFPITTFTCSWVSIVLPYQLFTWLLPSLHKWNFVSLLRFCPA